MSRQEKEAFVSGHSGSTGAEVVQVLSVPLAWVAAVDWIAADGLNPDRVLLAAALATLPVVLSMTTDGPAGLILLVLGVAASVLLRFRFGRPRDAAEQSTYEKAPVTDPHLAVLDRYRAVSTLCTCVAILAVDFPAFPRRFAKTETYGLSVMDTGVGIFAFSSGVSAGARAKPQSPAQVLVHALPLVVLGLVRLVGNRSVDYQEHVSEYGTDWNFFFTLAALVVLRAAFPVPPARAGLVALLVVVVYQWGLSVGGLEQYVLSAPRTGFVSSNREGLCSLAGMMALSLAGSQMGAFLRVRRTRAALVGVGLRLGGAALVGLAAAAFVHAYLPASRRLGNMTFVAWIVALNVYALSCLLLAVYWVGRDARQRPATSSVYQAVSRFQLPVFVVANLVTGAVNLGMDTLAATSELAVVVVALYALLLVGAALMALWLGHPNSVHGRTAVPSKSL